MATRRRAWSAIRSTTGFRSTRRGCRADLLTGPFLRLDGIQQLGFVSRVWPGAKHTRYEHSLGVMHLTRLAVGRLQDRFWAIPGSPATMRARQLRRPCSHDIGHYPYSHAIEELGRADPVSRGGGTSGSWNGAGDCAHPAGGGGAVEPAGGGRDDPRRPRENLRLASASCAGFLSGTLDMDKLDYLPRDAHGCSVPYGGVDAKPVARCGLTIVDLPDGLGGPFPGPRIAIDEKGVSPLHSLINARQEMFDNVYWHHTNRACMVMLLRAVQDALVAGDDHRPVPDRSPRRLAARLYARQPGLPESTPASWQTRWHCGSIHKRAVEVSAGAIELYGRLGNLWFDPAARRTVERQLSAAPWGTCSGSPCRETAVLIDIPKPERWKTDVWVAFAPAPGRGLHPLMHWRNVVGLGRRRFQALRGAPPPDPDRGRGAVPRGGGRTLGAVALSAARRGVLGTKTNQQLWTSKRPQRRNGAA